METIVMSIETLHRLCRPVAAPAALPAHPPVQSAARRWPEHRRCEQVLRQELLARHPEILAGVASGHDGGDEDGGESDCRRAIRNWAADLLEVAK